MQQHVRYILPIALALTVVLVGMLAPFVNTLHSSEAHRTFALQSFSPSFSVAVAQSQNTPNPNFGFSEVDEGIENTTKPPSKSASESCGFTGWATTPLTCAANGILSMFGLLLWVAGVVLNQAVVITVTQMGTLISGTGGDSGIPTIYTTWEIVRNFANVIFIFTFLAIGIGTILNVDEYGIKKLLPKLVIAALLINFSFFITQAVIDTSNLLSASIYQNMDINRQCANGADESVWSLECGDNGLSDTIMNALKLQTIYDTESRGLSAAALKKTDAGDIFLAAMLGSLLVLIVAFVFFAAAILLIIRFAVLVMLMVLSPAAFACMVLPKTKEYWDKWLKTLLDQAIFAPALMLLLFISLRIVTSPTFSSGGENLSFAAAMAGNQSSAGVFISYGIVVAFFVMSLIVAKKLGAYGSSVAMQWGGAASFGVAGWAGRNTIGRGFSGLAQNEWLKERASGDGFGGFAARAGLRTFQAGAKASYDFRSAPGVGDVAKSQGVELGKAGGKGGYDAQLKRQVEQREAFAKTLEPSVAARARMRQRQEQKIDAQAAPTRQRHELATAAHGKATDRVQRAQTKLMEAKGRFGENSAEAKKAQQELRSAQNLQQLAKQRMDTEGQKLEGYNKRKQQVGKVVQRVADRRKARYATTLATEPIGGRAAGKVGEFFGLKLPVARKNKEAAAKIRKGDETVQSLVDKALKKSGQVKEEKKETGDDASKGGSA